MRQNLTRYDLSDRLIHFTRAFDQANDGSVFPIEWSFGEVVEDDILSPFFLLRRILRKRQLISTWSYRAGKPTVYGPHPAVCFTEMPLAAFLEASSVRAKNGEHVSSYGVLLRKEHAYATGARPVIYGLSAPASVTMYSDGTRQFSDQVLPKLEQFRYVAYDPTKGGRLDWSHEREWRWPNRAWHFFDENAQLMSPREPSAEFERWVADRYRDRSDLDGLNLDQDPFGDIGFLVKNQRQAQLLLNDILWMVDSDQIPRDLFTFILRLDALALAPLHNLVAPQGAAAAIAAAAIDLTPFYQVTSVVAQTQVSRLRQLIAAEAAITKDDGLHEVGGCWLWLHDNTHPLVRSLVREGDVTISHAGRYLVQLYEFDDSLGVRARQEATTRIGEAVAKEFGATSSYFSVIGSDDVDGLPFYTDDAGVWGRIHANFAHDEDDF